MLALRLLLAAPTAFGLLRLLGRTFNRSLMHRDESLRLLGDFRLSLRMNFAWSQGFTALSKAGDRSPGHIYTLVKDLKR